jgi:hypothetical protein
MGFYWQPAFTPAMSFDGATYGQLTDYTVASYDSQLGMRTLVGRSSTDRP